MKSAREPNGEHASMSSEEKGYWLVTAVVTDPAEFQNYTSVAGPVIVKGFVPPVPQ